MRIAVAGLCVVVAFGSLLACSDGQDRLALTNGGWLLTVSVNGFPGDHPEYPVSIRFKAHLVGVVSGANAEDGTVLVFRSSGGTFENGLEEIEATTVDGIAEATFTAEIPGAYEMSVKFGDEETRMTFSLSP